MKKHPVFSCCFGVVQAKASFPRALRGREGCGRGGARPRASPEEGAWWGQVGWLLREGQVLELGLHVGRARWAVAEGAGPGGGEGGAWGRLR